MLQYHWLHKEASAAMVVGRLGNRMPAWIFKPVEYGNAMVCMIISFYMKIPEFRQFVVRKSLVSYEVIFIT